MTADRARKRAVRARMAATGEPYSQAARRLRRVEVVDTVAVPRGYTGRRWGRVEPAAAGWRVTVVAAGTETRTAREAAPVRVDYTTPGTWEPGSVALPPVVWLRPDGRWIWAANGWALDEPGDVADAPPCGAPSPDLPFEVRLFSRDPDRTWGLDYDGSPPYWHTHGWCATEAQAARLAAAEMRWSGPDHHERAQLWGPGPAGGRALALQLDAPPGGRPHVPRPPHGTVPGVRPDTPPPAAEPSWPAELPERDRVRYDLRLWSPTCGWEEAGWFSCRQYAAIAAQSLCVGVAGEPWPFAEIWGPHYRRDEVGHLTGDYLGRALSDYEPDLTSAESRARGRQGTGALDLLRGGVGEPGHERPRRPLPLGD